MEKRTDSGQPRIASTNTVVSFPFDMIEKGKNKLSIQICKFKFSW